MFCRRFGTLLVLVAVLLPIQLQAETITPSVTSDLYLTDGPRLWHHTTDATTTIGPDSEQTIQALAADPEHERLFCGLMEESRARRSNRGKGQVNDRNQKSFYLEEVASISPG